MLQLLRNRYVLWGFKFGVLALLGWGIHGTVTRAWSQLDARSWSLSPGWIVASGGLYLVGQLPSALYWRRIMETLGQHPPLGQAIRAHFIGQLGKYVPGKALVLVLRTVLIQGMHVRGSVAAVAVFVETMTTMAIGALLAVPILCVEAIRDPAHRWLALVAGALALVLGLPTVPPVFRELVRKLAAARLPPEAYQHIERLNWRALAWGWFLLAVGWVIQAWGLWAVVVALSVPGTRPLADFPLYLAAVTMSVVAGFVSMIPGGLGVRDSMLMLILSALRLSAGEALLTAILQRLVSLVAEVVASAILYCLPLGKANAVSATG